MPTPIEAGPHADRKHVCLQVGNEAYGLKPAEALQLARQLTDAVQLLTEKRAELN